MMSKISQKKWTRLQFKMHKINTDLFKYLYYIISLFHKNGENFH